MHCAGRRSPLLDFAVYRLHDGCRTARCAYQTNAELMIHMSEPLSYQAQVLLFTLSM